MSRESKITDEELAKMEKLLAELPEDARKYYEKDFEKKLRPGRAEFAVPPVREDVELWLIYDEDCPHCTAFMQSKAYEAIVRYAWAKGIKFKAVLAQEALENLLFSVIWPSRDPETIMPAPDRDLWTPIHTPMLVVRKKGGEARHVVVNTDTLKDKPHHYFYWVQMAVEGEVTVPTLSMALVLRKLQSEHRKRKRGGEEELLPEELAEIPVPDRASGPETVEGELSPCEAQPRC